ncbi:MAG: hypothetical protein QF773_05375 [Lentisphaeria bacterium]|nr:hypothetical protein [Lentisphaeria bacterium]
MTKDSPELILQILYRNLTVAESETKFALYFQHSILSKRGLNMKVLIIGGIVAALLQQQHEVHDTCG